MECHYCQSKETSLKLCMPKTNEGSLSVYVCKKCCWNCAQRSRCYKTIW